MKVIVNGKIGYKDRLNEIITEVIDSMGERMGLTDETEFALENVEFKVLFDINGEEKYATVPREINGETVNEMLMVSVHLDDEGNIIQSEDNEEESFYDGYTLAQSIGQEYKYEGIESAYQNEDLEAVELIGENTDTDVMAAKYRVIDNPGVEVVRHFKGNILVAEYVYTPEDGLVDAVEAEIIEEK